MRDDSIEIDGLSDKQEQAIIAMLTEPTLIRAAQAVGVAPKTIYRWMDEPAFSDAYRRARRQAFAQAIAICQQYAPLAVQVLAQVMTDKTAAHAAKVTAATAMLKFGRESMELDDLAERVVRLEKAQGDRLPPERSMWRD